MDELEAIHRLKRGDISGLALLVRRYQVQAVRTAYLITQERNLAEDVVQTAFIQVYRQIDGFDTKRPFAPWFMRSVVNAAVQATRKQHRQISLDSSPFEDGLPDPAPSPESAVESAEFEQVVWQALQKLSPEQRAAVVLRYYLGFSESEMSDKLDCAPGTVKWRLHSARKQLRILLRTQEE